MMKKTWSILMMAGAIALTSCGGDDKKEGDKKEGDKKEDAQPVAAVYSVNTEATVINWTGTKIKEDSTTKEHVGTISLSEGTIQTTDGNVTGGNFVIDMASIASEEAMGADLVAHLKDGDFFAVDSIPTASFDVISVADGNVTGTLNVLGKPSEVTFPLTIVAEESVLTATGEFELDFAPFNAKYIQPGAPIQTMIKFGMDLKANVQK